MDNFNYKIKLIRIVGNGSGYSVLRICVSLAMCHPVPERRLVTKGNKTESKGGGIKQWAGDFSFVEMTGLSSISGGGKGGRPG